jgi:RNA polymerase sigma factor (sigma-70 family)
MAGGQGALILQRLRRLLGGRSGDDLGDGPLLERFRRQRDEAAFTALVRRHGPLVLGVCRRVLRQEQDAEDCFQATFLVLARKAGSIRRAEALGPWLYEVAYRIALKARARAARQRTHERQAADMPRTDLGREELRRELRGVLDEELHHLPERYRRLLLLCDLQGESHQEAARRLGLPPGSLSRHLGRARELLRERLLQRGITLSVALLSAVLFEEGTAPVSAGLVDPTVRAALGFAAGRTAAGSVPAAVTTLAEGALHAMALTRWKVVLSAVVVVGVLATAAGVVARHAAGPRPAEPAARDLPIPPAANAFESDKRDLQGDSLPRGALARLGTVRFRLSGWGQAVTFTPDGRQLVAADGGMGAGVWDVATGRPLRSLSRNDLHKANCVVLSPDGRTAAVGAGNGTVHLFDFLTGMSVRRLSGQREPVTALAFSPDGKLLASGGEFDYPRRRGENNPIVLWDVATGQERRRLAGHLDTVCCVVFSPDGKTLASGGGRYDATLRLWDVATGNEVFRRTGHGGEVEAVAFSPDGGTIATGGLDKTVRLWDPATGQQKGHLTGHRSDVMAVAFSPDGKSLASGGFDRTLRLWDPAAGKQVWAVEGDQTGTNSSTSRRLTGGFAALAFAPDGKTLAAACRDHTLRLYDAADGREVRPDGDQFCAVDTAAFGRDRDHVWTMGGDRKLRLWEATGKEVRAVETTAGEPGCVAFSADGRLGATGGEKDHTARVWDLETGKELQRLVTPDVIAAVAFSPDGRTLATANRWQRAEVRLWDVGTGQPRHRLPAPAEQGNWVLALAFTPDGRTLVGASNDGIIVFWDPDTGVETGPRLKHFQTCQRMVLSPDGRTLAVGTMNGLVTLYETATGKERLRCRAWPFTFAPDGRLLAGGEGALVSLWDTATGEQAGRFHGHRGDVTALAFAADGTRLVSGSADTTALVWEVKGPSRPAAEPAPADLERHWLELAGGDAAAASRAIGSLAAAPDQAVPFLDGKLQPVRPAESKATARLLTDLDAEEFAARDRAAKELERLGEAAEPALRQALSGDVGPEVRRRLEWLLQRLDAWPPERLRTVRALEALERIGTPEGRTVVARLARESAGTRTGAAAADVLRRLETRSAGERR